MPFSFPTVPIFSNLDIIKGSYAYFPTSLLTKNSHFPAETDGAIWVVRLFGTLCPNRWIFVSIWDLKLPCKALIKPEKKMPSGSKNCHSPCCKTTKTLMISNYFKGSKWIEKPNISCALPNSLLLVRYSYQGATFPGPELTAGILLFCPLPIAWAYSPLNWAVSPIYHPPPNAISTYCPSQLLRSVGCHLLPKVCYNNHTSR